MSVFKRFSSQSGTWEFAYSREWADHVRKMKDLEEEEYIAGWERRNELRDAEKCARTDPSKRPSNPWPILSH